MLEQGQKDSICPLYLVSVPCLALTINITYYLGLSSIVVEVYGLQEDFIDDRKQMFNFIFSLFIFAFFRGYSVMLRAG